jgi:hypothetical protein
MNGRFIFVSSSFRRADIGFDVSFIVKLTKFSLIDTPLFVIMPYTNIKNCDYLFIYLFLYL